MVATPSSVDTIRRNRELSAEGFNFIGTGVSGGEEGALKGPSIMPGGQKEAHELVAPILTKIAAVAEDGEPCDLSIGRCRPLCKDGSQRHPNTAICN